MNQPPCAPPQTLQTPLRFFTGVLAVLVTALGLWMFRDLTSNERTKYPCEHAFYRGIDSPILAVELASTKEELATAIEPACDDQLIALKSDEAKAQKRQELQPKARLAIHHNTVLDCFFIPLYTSFVLCFGFLFAVKSDDSKQGTSKMGTRYVLALTMLATAAADYLENLGIFRALDLRLSDEVARHICWPSHVKWTLLGLGLILTAIILLRSGSLMYSLAAKRLFAIAYLAIGILLIFGVHVPVLIGLAMSLFSLLVLLQIIALLGPYLAHLVKPKPPIYEDDFCEKRKSAGADVAVHT